MKTFGIHSSFAGSLFLHVLIISAAILFARLSDSNIPTPYMMVSLVDFSSPHIPAPLSMDDEFNLIEKQIETPYVEIPPTVYKQTTKAPIPEKQAEAPTELSPEAHEQIDRRTIPVKQAKTPTKPPQPRAQTQARVQPQAKDKPKEEDQQRFIRDRMEALEAIKRLEAMRAVEKVVELRKMVDIGEQKTKTAGGRSLEVDRVGDRDRLSIGEDYWLTVVNKIRHQWIFPEDIDRDLEAIVSIKVAIDGNVTIGRMEKSSGDPLFDRSVLRAINKASPLPPPPHEMEFGARFRP